MRFRIAEEGHHAVAEIFGNVTAEARYRFRGYTVVAVDRLAPFLGIELWAIPVEPTRSQNSTVRWRRSPVSPSRG
jgi:hypothetical protein